MIWAVSLVTDLCGDTSINILNGQGDNYYSGYIDSKKVVSSMLCPSYS